MCSGPVGFALTNSTWTRRPERCARPYAAPSRHDPPQDIVQPHGGHEDVDEPGSRHVHLPDEGRVGEAATIASATARGVAPARGAHGEREVRREVAVLLLPGLLELRLGQVSADAELRRGGGQPCAQPRPKVVLDHVWSPTIAARTVWTSAAVSNGLATNRTGSLP